MGKMVDKSYVTVAIIITIILLVVLGILLLIAYQIGYSNAIACGTLSKL